MLWISEDNMRNLRCRMYGKECIFERKRTNINGSDSIKTKSKERSTIFHYRRSEYIVSYAHIVIIKTDFIVCGSQLRYYQYSSRRMQLNLMYVFYLISSTILIIYFQVVFTRSFQKIWSKPKPNNTNTVGRKQNTCNEKTN